MAKKKICKVHIPKPSAAYLESFLVELSTRELTEIMRRKRVPIPKIKCDMVERLAEYLAAEGESITVTIG